MQNKDVKNANQSSVGTQAQQPQKSDKTVQTPGQKPDLSSSRTEKKDDKFDSSQSSRINK